MKSQSNLSKSLRKSKEISSRVLLSVFERSIESLILESVCDIILFLIAAAWFSPIVTSKAFACVFCELKYKFCET